jgi:predicted transcriptional regulator
MTPILAIAVTMAAAAPAAIAVAAIRAIRAIRRPTPPQTPTAALLPLCAALEPNAWRSVVIAQQLGHVQVSSDGTDDVVPLLAVALLAAIEQRTWATDTARARMAQAGQGQWVSSDEVVF